MFYVAFPSTNFHIYATNLNSFSDFVYSSYHFWNSCLISRRRLLDLNWLWIAISINVLECNWRADRWYFIWFFHLYYRALPHRDYVSCDMCKFVHCLRIVWWQKRKHCLLNERMHTIVQHWLAMVRNVFKLVPVVFDRSRSTQMWNGDWPMSSLPPYTIMTSIENTKKNILLLPSSLALKDFRSSVWA